MLSMSCICMPMIVKKVLIASEDLNVCKGVLCGSHWYIGNTVCYMQTGIPCMCVHILIWICTSAVYVPVFLHTFPSIFQDSLGRFGVCCLDHKTLVCGLLVVACGSSRWELGHQYCTYFFAEQWPLTNDCPKNCTQAVTLLCILYHS